MSSFQRFASWLLTDAGKKFAYIAAGAATTTAMLATTLPHTILIGQYRDFYHLYRKGFTVPLSQKLQNRFQKALELAEVKEDERHLFKPFAATGFDIVSAGSSYSSFGVIVGIPANFAYDKVDDVDKYVIKLRDDSIPWELDEGKQLMNSLVLSENAQIYAMAREIKFRQTLKIVLDTVVTVVSCAGTYGLANAINVRLNLYNRPRPIRLVMYCLVGAFTFGSYALCKDFSQVYYENRIDKELKEKNQIFAEGGKEFYTKLLERNKALRKFLGKEGERAYSVLGNENYLFRYRHIPLVQRKEFFESAS